MRKAHLLLGLILGVFITASGQGYISGDLQVNADFFIRDTSIFSSKDQIPPQYDKQKTAVASWLMVNYNNPDWNFDAGIRLDIFLNSNVFNPQEAYNAQGIGYWYVRKSFNKLKITGGYFYHQFGNGISYRSYEERALGIDNATFGVLTEYDITDNLRISGFAGVIKNRLSLYKPMVIGASIDGLVKAGKVTLIPGGAVLNRTLDEASMALIVSTIESYPEEDRFIPKYNTYVFHAWNTLNYKNFSWMMEGAYKTSEAIVGEDGSTLEDNPGYVAYTTFTYAQKGLGITLALKRTDKFSLRTSPNENPVLLQGLMNFIPPTARQNSLRLTSRYNAATQEYEETAGALDITFTPKKGHTMHFSYSEIWDNDFDDHFFTELYVDYENKKSRKFKTLVGFQFINYNQTFYEDKPAGKEKVLAYTPFFHFTYNITRKKSIRFEFQYQNVKKDFGQWLYGLVELTIAPKWTFSVSDMWNFKPNSENPSSKNQHYYSVFTSLTHKSHRFTLSYVKQVEGIVCTGGVCRFEPAFNGVRFQMLTNF